MFHQFKKTRIAPTPSGFLHVGNILSFAITATLARKHGAKILLRIDDLDRARVNQQYLQDIFDTLDFLEIPWDEGPRNVKDFEDNYSQTHRFNMYKDALASLADKELVFACTCSRIQVEAAKCACVNKRIPLSTKNASWRLKTDNTLLNIKCYENRHIDTRLPESMQNFVVKKKDGFPAYQLSSVIDDLYYDVDLVVRGQDLWESTLAQQYLAKALIRPEFTNVTFLHHPLIMNASGNKLSKSAGATSIQFLRESGFTAAGIYTLIADLLGFKEPIISWEQLTELAAQ